MTKKLLQVLLVLFVTGGFAQSQVKGVIKDIITNEAISHVTISSTDEKNMTISNEEGAFALSLPAGVQKFTISSLGYNSYEFNTQNLPADGIYFIEPKEFVMEEMVVMNVPINEFINSLVQSSIAKMQSPLLLSIYYREFVKINDTYTKFADGLVDYSLSKSRNKISTDVTVKQSRAARLPGDDDQALDVASGLDVRKAVMRDCGFSGINVAIFEDDNYKDLDFIIKTQKDKDGRNTEVITFTPKAEVKESLFMGEIIYDPQTKVILNVKVSMAPSHAGFAKERNFIIIKGMLKGLEYHSGFKVVDGKYMLSHSSRNGVIRIWNKKKYDELIDFKSDLIVTKFSSDILEIGRKDKYKDRSLYERGNNYTDKFWLQNNSIVLTAEEEQIIKSLENKN